MTILRGESVRLRPATLDDVPELARIRATPEVHRHWRGGDNMVAAVLEDFREEGSTAYVIELDSRVVGWIQWQAEEEPDYRHASMDIYVDPAVHGRGVGTDAVRTLARQLIDDHGHRRLTIDPAADNAAAIRAYTKVGFRPVGIERRAERGADGTWHDVLLMDLLAEELTDPDPS
jgi:aminoglycoside 6'-N-acetyltransferase